MKLVALVCSSTLFMEFLFSNDFSTNSFFERADAHLCLQDRPFLSNLPNFPAFPRHQPLASPPTEDGRTTDFNVAPPTAPDDLDFIQPYYPTPRFKIDYRLCNDVSP
jgi:hypothetical protein